MRQFAIPGSSTSSIPHPRQAFDLEIITRFQPDHGWTVTNVSASELNDTSDYVLGTQSAWFTHPAGDLPAWIETQGISINLEGKVLRLWLKIDGDLSALGDITFYAGDVGFNDYFKWPVDIGTTIEDHYVQAGQGWTVIDLGFGDATVIGSPTRDVIRALRLRVNATTGRNTTLHINGVAAYPEADAWPHGAVSICFDDGWSDVYTTARPILDTYGYPATVYAIRELIGQPQRLTLDQLHRLEDMAGWEIAGHSDRLAVHNANWTNISPQALEEDSANLQRWLRAEGFRGANHCAYPEGAYDADVLKTVRRSWRAARTIIQATTEVPSPPNPYKLRSWSVASSDPVEGVIARIEAAKAGKQWCILTFHHIVAEPGAETEYAIDDFQTIVDHIHQTGVPVRLVSDVLGI